MPKAQIVRALPGVPLSVTAVSAKLGVSASTLRTWERRYGLGPSDERRAGAHRRYRPEDVERLSRMLELVRSGVGAADAAATVLAMEDSELDVTMAGTTVPLVPVTLVEAARSCDLEHLERLIGSSVTVNGLVHTWSDLIEPAMEWILGSDDGEEPGSARSSILTVAVLAVIRSVSDHRPRERTPDAAGVVVMADQDHSLAAHVAGVALQWNGIPTSVISTGLHAGSTGAQRFAAYRARTGASVVVVMGRGASCEKLMDCVAGTGDVDIVLVGADSPHVLDQHVQRVRTLSACVDETVALARAKMAQEPTGDTTD